MLMGFRLAGLSLVHSITSVFSESSCWNSGRFWCTTSMSRATALSSLVDFDLWPQTEVLVVCPSFTSQPLTHYCRICKDNVMQLMSELVRILDHEACPRMTRKNHQISSAEPKSSLKISCEQVESFCAVFEKSFSRRKNV